MSTDSTGKVPVGCAQTPPHPVNEITGVRKLLYHFNKTVVSTISDFGFRHSFGLRASGFGFDASVAGPAWMLTMLLTILTPCPARGDGGVVQLRQSQGPFTVTVFSSPETTRDGLTDVSVLVQWKKSGDVVLDADVKLTLESSNSLAQDRSDPLCGISPPATAIQSADFREPPTDVPATHKEASNKLLYAAALKLSRIGATRLHVGVVRGPESARFDCPIQIAQTSANFAALWPCLAFPPIAIVAFAMNQWLRRESLEKGLEPQSSPPLIHGRPQARIERTSKFCFAKL